MSNFQLAERKRTAIKLEIFGPPGCGKTLSSLMLAKEMGYERVAFIDTEDSAELYADQFDFIVAKISPKQYKGKEFVKKFLEFYNEAIESGAEIIILDTATHLWDAVKDYVTLLGGRYTDWNKGTPLWRSILDMILSSPVNTIICSRAEYEDVVQPIQVGDKVKYKVERLGLKADLRKMTDYEFTTVLSMNENHTFMCKKDRTGLFANNLGDDAVPRLMDASVAKEIRNWVDAGKIVKSEYKAITPQDIDSMENSTKVSKSKLDTMVAKTESVKPTEPINNSSPNEAGVLAPVVGKATPTTVPPAKKAAKTKPAQKNPLEDVVPVKIGGWEDEADAFVMAIGECKDHEQILEIANMVDIFIADNHLNTDAANFLLEEVSKKTQELEPKH